MTRLCLSTSSYLREIGSLVWLWLVVENNGYSYLMGPGTKMYDAPNADGTVGKAMQVLDQVAAFSRPVRFSELLANSPFPKPTLYRFVQTLTNQGMLAFDPERQTYSMGIRLVRLAHSAWRHSSLVPVARPYIEALAAKVGEAVHLAQFDNGHVLFVDKCKATDHFETLAQAGKIAPGYCTGVGRRSWPLCQRSSKTGRWISNLIQRIPPSHSRTAPHL